MNTKILFGGVCAVAAVGALVWFMNAPQPAEQQASALQPAQNSGTPAATTSADVPETANTTQGAPAVSPAATPATPVSPYTMAAVATHNSKSSCWSAINGKVYDLTSWISQHPGGAERILSICGKDGSAAFNGQHEGDRRPASELADYLLGDLSN